MHINTRQTAIVPPYAPRIITATIALMHQLCLQLGNSPYRILHPQPLCSDAALGGMRLDDSLIGAVGPVNTVVSFSWDLETQKMLRNTAAHPHATLAIHDGHYANLLRTLWPAAVCVLIPAW